MIKKIVLKLLWIYQRFFTLLSLGSCRYYPTCSEYAVQQFELNPLHTALFYSTKRVLSCNQLFRGGCDYVEIFRAPKIVGSLTKDEIKYWLVMRSEKRFYVIKNFSYKG